MKVGLIQLNSSNDKPASIEAARVLMERCIAEEKPDWLCLPEFFDFIGGTRDETLAAAEALPGGPAYAMLQDIARRHGVHVHGGSLIEKIEGEERVGNTTVVFDRGGKEVVRYRKIHMFDYTTPDGKQIFESSSMKPGVETVTYECEGLTIGCAICYDLRFPELFQALTRKGAHLIALPSAFTLHTGKDHWESLCRARAIETQTYFCAPGQTGTHTHRTERRQTWGHSMVVDPWGHIIAQASDGAGYVTARIEPGRIAKVRAAIPVSRRKTRYD